jgi:hypothetical protein
LEIQMVNGVWYRNSEGCEAAGGDMQAVIFIGIQASGKTTFYRERFFDTHVRLSLDMLRTRHREWLLVQCCLSAKQPVVIDNTNSRAANRARYIEPARRAGFRVIGYYFETELNAALARNSKRPGKQAIPVKGVLGTFKRLEPPAWDEGYDELYSVRQDPEKRFVVAAYPPNNRAGAAGTTPGSVKRSGPRDQGTKG